MGGLIICNKCDNYFHSHDGGSVIDDSFYCENCTGELEAYWESREEEWQIVYVMFATKHLTVLLS